MEHGRIESRAPKTYTEIFDECFPFYLSIGMTYEQYWEGDSALPIFYRKAFEMKQKRDFEDTDLKSWLQGRYMIEAISTCFGKDCTYPEKPHSFKDSSENKPKTEEEIMIENVEGFRRLVEAKQSCNE